MNENEIRKAAAALGRIGGQSTSERKAAAARANGRKGGRPRRSFLEAREIHMSYEADGQEIDEARLETARALVDSTGLGDVDECYEWLGNGPHPSNLTALWIEYNTQV